MDRIIAKELDRELMLYDPAKDAVHVLNPTARVVYECRRRGEPLAEIERVLRERFRADPSRDLSGEIGRCLQELREKGLVAP
ncbi:MAG: HPr-rel-A system PqqD family peptide chaperone [bacterium]